MASAITKTAGTEATLTLRADRNIIVNSDIGATTGALNITLSAANAASATVGGVNVNANLASNGGKILIGGATGTSTNGIGFARNLAGVSDVASVVVQQNKSITSNGGDITINGSSSLTQSGSYSSSKAGVYVKSGATILSSNGDLFITGKSTADINVFGVGFEASSGTLTRVGTGTGSGRMILNGVNSFGDNGALGMVNNGSYDRLHLVAPSVAHLVIQVNGNTQTVAYTYSPPNSGCGVQYPNCGWLQVPGANNSYLYAAYDVVSMATLPLYIQIDAGSGGKVYDGNTNATGVNLSAVGGPVGFNVASLGSVNFYSPSKNVNTYYKLNSSGLNPTTYTSGGNTYAIAYFFNGSYAITPKTLTPTAANKVYDGTDAAVLTATGLIVGDSVNFNYASGTFSDKNVADGKTVTATGVSLSGTDAGNYTLGSTTVSATANITPKEIAASGLTASNKVYDTNTSATVSGTATLALSAPGAGSSTDQRVYTGDDLTLNVATLSATFDNKNVGNGKQVSVSGLSLSGADASNYTLVQPSGLTANITPAQLTISGLSANNKVYNANTNATLSGTASLAGVLGSDTVGLSGSATAGTFSDKNVADGKAVTATLSGLSLSGADAGNYQISGVTSALTANITPAQLTVSGLSANNKVYDTNTNATLSGTASLAGVLGSDTVGLSGSATAGTFADKNVADGKSVTANLSGLSISGTDAGNYQINGVTSALTANITPVTLTVTASNASKTYDGQAYSGGNGVSYSGFAGSEDTNVLGGTLAYGGSSQGATNAGSYAITPSGLTANNGNYTLSYVNGTLTIDPATLTITVNPASRTYGSANPTFTGSITGFVPGQNAGNALTGSLTFNTSATPSSNVGNYGITGGGLTANNGNYVFVQAPGNASSLEITPASLTVTANNASMTANGQAYSGGNGVNYSGFVNNEDENVLGGSLAYGGSSQGATNAGSYAITPSGLSANHGNYTLSYLDGSLTINAAAVAPKPPVTEPQNYIPRANPVPQFAEVRTIQTATDLPTGEPSGLNYIPVTPQSPAGAQAGSGGQGVAAIEADNAPSSGRKNPLEDGLGVSVLPRSTLGPTNVYVIGGGINTAEAN